MIESRNSKSFREFIRYLDREIRIAKPYLYLIIEKLLKSHPRPLTKKLISDYLRSSLKTTESFEHLNIWSQLINKDELVIETSDGLILNIDRLSDDEKNRLLKVCAKRITNIESDFTGNKQLQTIIDDSDKESYYSKEDPQKRKSFGKVGYYLIRFKSNTMRYGDDVPLNEIKNYKINLRRRDIKIFRINTFQKIFVILYDTKADQIRIWGKAELVAKPQFSTTVPNIEFKNFEPLIEDGESIFPKWLLQEDKKESMFGNKQIISIDQVDFNRILNSAVHLNELFQKDHENESSEQSVKANLKTFEDPQTFTPSQEIKNAQKNLLIDEQINYNGEQILSFEDLPLEIPSKETLEKGINEIKKHLLIDRKTIEEIVIHLTSGRHVLLAGPIGTGKTRLAELIPKLFWNKEKNGYNSKVYTASHEWNVNDVIGGIVPRMKDDKPTYQIQDGCVTETVKRSWNAKANTNNKDNPYSGTWLVIDEFNRAEIDKAFGQLFTSLESRTLKIPDKDTPVLIDLKIPQDYRIIGTLNTSDKHYLFKLSDALKRRFAYIEIKSPSRNNAEQEIYYALLNATTDLSANISSLIKLDTNEKKLSENQPNVELISAIRSAYEILSFIRMTKDMGTAILKSIYQAMLIGTQINGYTDAILDIALNGNIIPQLEKVETTNIEVLMNFCFDDLHSFFHQMYNASDDDLRQKYADDFEYYLKFLEIPDMKQLLEGYRRKNISDENWNLILDKWNVQKSKNGSIRKLPIFKTSLEDLKKTFEFL